MVRIKHRYLLLNILYPDQAGSALKPSNSSGKDIPYSVQFRQPSSDQLSSKILLRLVRDVVSDLFGDYGAGKASGTLQVKYFSSATSTAIIRVSREYYRLVWAALTSIHRLPKPVDQACVIQVVRVSGTMRKAEEEAIRRARLSIRRASRPISGGTGGMESATAGAELDEDDDLDMVNGVEDLDDDESD